MAREKTCKIHGTTLEAPDGWTFEVCREKENLADAWIRSEREDMNVIKLMRELWGDKEWSVSVIKKPSPPNSGFGKDTIDAKFDSVKSAFGFMGCIAGAIDESRDYKPFAFPIRALECMQEHDDIEPNVSNMFIFQ